MTIFKQIGTLFSAISSYGESYSFLKENVLVSEEPQKIIENVLHLPAKAVENYGQSFSAIGAGIAMVGAVGVGVGQGIAVGRGLEAMARNPELFKKLQTSLIVGLAIVESSSIYSFIIALILSFK